MPNNKAIGEDFCLRNSVFKCCFKPYDPSGLVILNSRRNICRCLLNNDFAKMSKHWAITFYIIRVGKIFLHYFCKINHSFVPFWSQAALEQADLCDQVHQTLSHRYDKLDIPKSFTVESKSLSLNKILFYNLAFLCPG